MPAAPAAPAAREPRPAAGWWTLAAIAVVLTAAAWLREPSVPYLVATAAATAAAVWAALRGGPTGRWWRLAVAALGAAFVAAGIAPQRTLWQLEHDWPLLERQILESTASALDGALATAAADARAAAAAVLAPEGGPAAAASLPLLARGGGERAIVLLDGERPLAWAGTLRVPIDSLAAGLGFVRTPFHDALTVQDARGQRRATAVVLLQTRAPADELAVGLAAAVAGRTPAAGVHFSVEAGPAPAVADAALRLDDGRWLVARLDPLVRDEAAFRERERARTRGLLLLAVLGAALLGSVWGRALSLRHRLAAIGALLVAAAVVPLAALSNATPLFDASYFFVPRGGPLTASAGALLLTAALLLVALLAVRRARVRVPSRPAAAAVALLVATLGPFVLRDLAGGIAAPTRGGSPALWLGWHLSLFLAATVVLLVGASAGRAALGRHRGVAPLVAPALAAVGALLAQPLLAADGRWPPWYPLLWIVAVGALAVTRRTRAVVLAAAAVASLGAMTLVWGGSVRARMALAESDVAGLGRSDPVIETLLARFADDLTYGPLPTTRPELLAAYAASDLAAADHAVQLTTWTPLGARAAEVTDVGGGEPLAELRALADSARARDEPLAEPIATPRGVRLAVAVPGELGWVTTAAVAPRTQLLPDDPYAPLFVGAAAPAIGEPYLLSLSATREEALSVADDGAALTWTRRDDALHGDWVGRLAGVPTAAHVELALRSPWALLQRGTLLLLLDLLVVGTLWLLNALGERSLPRWLRAQRRLWARSYRVRLSLALFGFFVAPAVAFGTWASRQLQGDSRQARELLVFEALRAAVADAQALGVAPSGGAAGGGGAALGALAADLAAVGDAPLLVYRGGLLAAASDELVATLAPLGRLLPRGVALGPGGAGHVAVSRIATVGEARVLVGYRALPGVGPERVMLAVPARADELALDARRRDVSVAVLFSTVLGALAALWLSGVAARQLARPIGALRGAALAIAAGEREPPLSGPEPPAEFKPVFSAFRRMAADLGASRSALEAAERRIAAVLADVASAVIATDARNVVTLFNPAAHRLFGSALAVGAPLAALGVPELASPAAGDAEMELELRGRRLHARTTPLHRGGGAVLTLDDVTEVARAQRVLAWGEMARQVAHEIKNPLTPIRLGVQHLRRAYHARRDGFEGVLEQNVERILAEIDRLDEIARAFSRYGTAPEERAAAEAVDVSAVVRDVVELERLGADGALAWRLDGADRPRLALARDEELREVLLNVLENARLAGAGEVRVSVADGPEATGPGAVVVTVRDDGGGIPAALLSRVFEPHFSTRTSGSGLGLAISRRLLDGWGGTIALDSREGAGTTVRIALAAVRPR